MHCYHFTHVMNAPPRQRTLPSACGKEVPRHNTVSIIIATPEWDKDWCHDWVRVFLWKEYAKQM